ncbi:hypothetical protein H4R99_001232 [Coemansia sp. RSA 1722]|nr:hypothetical protein IWW45_001302 [Coemansia sp. RSA 485]KAJ2603539.1 hypothetical protein GGF39_000032 [Coemansia sp. RSA 1721]KAJ2605315.1 hypothetical protein H4R99_001232 [Coemansia sp. RSA 1722]KAJ2638689.1 hypothetical protein GGF40_001465 [Coemansia sp. RSA 1286]
MTAATKEHCRFCFDVLIAHLTGNNNATGIQADFDTGTEYPLFVTWDKHSSRDGDSRLRGCIGNFSPMELSNGLRDYALTSALHDSRFRPISLREVPFLSCTVSLLTDFEKAKDCMDWEVGKHGVWIEFRGNRGERRTATFLPQIASEQGWSKTETIDHLLRKGGYQGPVGDDVYEAIKLTRYQSQKAELSYDDYKAMSTE